MQNGQQQGITGGAAKPLLQPINRENLKRLAQDNQQLKTSQVLRSLTQDRSKDVRTSNKGEYLTSLQKKLADEREAKANL